MPEKNLSEISRPMKDQYEKGKFAMHRDNLDYAVSIFQQILKAEPGFFECRQALRAAQLKKHGLSTNVFKKMIGTAGSSPLIAKGQFAMRNNPQEAMEIAEQMLESDPGSGPGQRLLAEAALALDFKRTAVAALEMVRKVSPKDKESAMQLANLYPQTGQPEKGEAVYLELRRLYPGDPNIDMAYKNFAANRTMKEKGYEQLESGEGSYRDILRDKGEAEALEQEGRQLKSSDVAANLIRKNEQLLKQDPNNMRLVRTIAGLYSEKKDYETALSYYQRILDVEGAADASLEKEIADTVVRNYDQVIAHLDPHASDHAEQAAKLEAEKNDFVLTDCQRRAENYPSDLQVRFELGVLFFKADKISEAIQEFQRSQNNPQRRVQSLGYLGQCFAKRGMHEMAVRKIQEALKEKLVFDDEKKEMIYTLGAVYEKMGKTHEAIKQYELIYEVDIGYKDVGPKVESYHASGGAAP
jgi:tetratricopeptide (TPR) repeat protein